MHFNLFESQSAKDIKMDVPTTKAKIAFKKNDSHAWGWSTTIIRASPEEILAFAWDTLSRANTYADTAVKNVDEEPNEHNKLVYVKKATPKIIDDRDFLTRAVWKKDVDGRMILVNAPSESKKRIHLKNVVRGRYPSTMKITRLSDKETRIEYVIQIDFGGALPAWLTNSYIGSNLGYVTDIQAAFQALREADHFDADDGKAVGEVMVVKTKAEKHRGKGETKVDAWMRELIKKYRGLEEITVKYDFFHDMMVRVVQNKLRPAENVSTKLCNVSKKEGRKIGSGLAMSLASSLTAEAAVDEWIGKYPALQELDKEEVWFRPMLDTVALRLLGEVPWGLKMRVFIGAGLSVLDMASDINVIVLYLGSSEEKAYGKALLGMIAACVVIQLFLVYLQCRKRPLTMLREMLVVLTGLKPG
jgi:hypothetical protein